MDFVTTLPHLLPTQNDQCIAKFKSMYPHTNWIPNLVDRTLSIVKLVTKKHYLVKKKDWTFKHTLFGTTLGYTWVSLPDCDFIICYMVCVKMDILCPRQYLRFRVFKGVNIKYLNTVVFMFIFKKTSNISILSCTSLSWGILIYTCMDCRNVPLHRNCEHS